MNALVVGLALLVAANTSAGTAQKGSCAKTVAKKQDTKKSSTPAVDPNAVVAKSHGGKVFVMSDAPPSVEGEDLNKWLATRSPVAELTKKANEDRWPITYIAVFKKPPAKGPITVEFMDKKDMSTLVDQYSPQTLGGSVVFQEPYDLDTNNGFNKGHTYVIKVGQIIKNKFVSYANGEISLK